MNRFISNQSKELKKKLFKVFHRIPNSTSYWHLSDKKDRFEENFKKHPTSPHLLNYKKNPITYEYNNYGFRTPDDFILLFCYFLIFNLLYSYSLSCLTLVSILYLSKSSYKLPLFCKT